MMKKKGKDNSAVVAAVCIVGIVLFGGYGLFGAKLKRWSRDVFSDSAVGAVGAGGMVADVSGTEMKAYLGSIAACSAINLRIVETTEEYVVEVLGSATTSASVVRFEVARKPVHKFAWTPIEELVAKGLEVPASKASHPLSWKGFSIATNEAESVWVVSVHGVAGEGVLRLSLGEAYANCRVNLPALFPIWDYLVYVSPHREEILVGSIVRTPRSPPILPDRAKGLCGYKLVAVVGRTVWFQVMYDDAVVEDIRRKWPALEINYRVLDNGAGFSSVRFEGGKIMKPGDEAVFDDDQTLLKLEQNAFVGRHAVLFRYYEPGRRAIADLLCVSLQQK